MQQVSSHCFFIGLYNMSKNVSVRFTQDAIAELNSPFSISFAELRLRSLQKFKQA